MVVDDQNTRKGEHDRGGCMVGFRVKANKGVQ